MSHDDPIECLIAGKRHSLGDVLGKGNSGIVYAGLRDGSKTPVAVKVFTGPSKDAHRHAEREASLGSLTIRNSLVARGPFPFSSKELEGRVAVTMPMARTDLEQVMAERQFTPDEAAGIVARIAVAAHDAHKQGLVHSDIKPANIFIDRHGNHLLGDWGGVQKIGDPDHGIASLGYAAPEAVLSGAFRVTEKRDAYSLSCLLYELNTGRDPQETWTLPLRPEVVAAPLKLKTADRHLDQILEHGTAVRISDRSSSLDLMVDLCRYPSARREFPADIQREIAFRFTERQKEGRAIRDGKFEYVTQTGVSTLPSIDENSREKIKSININIRESAGEERRPPRQQVREYAKMER